MSAPRLLGQNLLEAATVTTTTIASDSSAARLYDRGRSPQATASAAAQWDVKVDLGASPTAVTAFAIINHNCGVADLTLAYSDDDISYTTADTFTGVSGTDIYRTISTQTRRYWRLRVPVFASAAAIGEFFLGAEYVLTVEPAHTPNVVDTIGASILVETSIGGSAWGTRLGSSRKSYQWTWNVLSQTDWDGLVTWFGYIYEGARAFALQDVDGNAKWVRCRSGLQGSRVLKTATTSYLRVVQLAFEDAL